MTLVLALELATMPAYVLIGYRRMRIDGLEGALKYFLLSMLTSLVMLYGMSFLYGVTGSSFMSEFDLSAAGTLGVLAVLFTFVGLFAKLSARRSTTGRPTPTPAPSLGPSRSSPPSPSSPPWSPSCASHRRSVPRRRRWARRCLIAAVASMLLGNLAALTQTDIRRMMAYSGVAHTGYLLLAVSTLTATGYASAIFYVARILGAFARRDADRCRGGPGAQRLRGTLAASRCDGLAHGAHARLARGNPAARRVLRQAVRLPRGARTPDSGCGWSSQWSMSVVSAGYYLRIVHSAFLVEGGPAEKGANPWPAVVAVLGCAALTAVLGIAAGPALTWMGAGLP